MFWYSRLGVNILSFIVALFFFSITFVLENNSNSLLTEAGIQLSSFNNLLKSKPIKVTFSSEEVQLENKNLEKEKVVEEPIKDYEWAIEIPMIGLLAPIKEGTTSKIMEEAVGHFEETGSINGNIGLAAHNRGYPKNYFENLKKLKIGDKIFYKRWEEKREYEVIETLIIKDDDWSHLENTEDNRLTLITCVENQPEYRRCIKAKEIN